MTTNLDDFTKKKVKLAIKMHHEEFKKTCEKTKVPYSDDFAPVLEALMIEKISQKVKRGEGLELSQKDQAELELEFSEKMVALWYERNKGMNAAEAAAAAAEITATSAAPAAPLVAAKSVAKNKQTK
jgi:hypothetical protein